MLKIKFSKPFRFLLHKSWLANVFVSDFYLQKRLIPQARVTLNVEIHVLNFVASWIEPNAEITVSTFLTLAAPTLKPRGADS